MMMTRMRMETRRRRRQGLKKTEIRAGLQRRRATRGVDLSR